MRLGSGLRLDCGITENSLKIVSVIHDLVTLRFDEILGFDVSLGFDVTRDHGAT